MPLAPDTILHGNYRVVRFINSGGFGCTYEAIHILFNERVAIKEFFVRDFCNRNEADGEVTVGTTSRIEFVDKLKQKFLQEAVAIRSLNHNNIVRVTDVFEQNGTAYYVMDYIEGMSLKQMITDRGPLPEATALKYIRQVASALDYIHSKNRLHLDIKPGNIMIAPDDHAVVIDFGASKVFDNESGALTQTMCGLTKPYASPEQLNAEMSSLKPTADIYSLGATLYSLLTATVPPSAFSRLNSPMEPLPSNVSAKTSAAVIAALALALERRPQSISAFLNLLGNDASNAKNVVPQQRIVNDAEKTEIIADVEKTELLSPNPVRNDTVEVRNVDNVREFMVNGVKFNMIGIVGGTYIRKIEKMFSSTRVAITLSNFYLAQTQVTQQLWYAVMGSNPSRFRGVDRPVETVSREDCLTFINLLNSITGLNFRLPTETEWEYAARGGNFSNNYKYSGGNNLDSVAWYMENSNGETHDVMTKAPNELGLYDMSGNVWEWCHDFYGDYSTVSSTDPKGPEHGTNFVVRGGGWSGGPVSCRVTNRGYSEPASRNDYLGLRLAL